MGDSRMKLRALCLLLLFLPLAGCGRSSEETVREFFLNIAEDDIAASVALFSPELKARFPQEELTRAATQLSQHMKKHQGLERLRIKGGIITYNELALYDATLSFGDGTSRKLQITVLYRNGDWYVNTAL